MLKFFIVMLNISLYLFYIASGEPYVHEFKEFAGVTIILRSTPNPKAFGNYDGHGKTSMQATRRKSEYQHPQSNTQDKFEHGDKTDHTGILFLFKNNRIKNLFFSISKSHYHSKHNRP